MKYVIVFDVMLKERFVCTLKMPILINMIEGFNGKKPIICYDSFQQFVEQHRPSLKGKDYKIRF